jgi:pilus assembly protein Flp/PilA
LSFIVAFVFVLLFCQHAIFGDKGFARMFSVWISLIRNTTGATAIEYALIATLIALAALAAFSLLGTNLIEIYNSVATKI